MGIIGSLIIGLIVGFVARMLKPGNDSLGLLATMLLGVAGAFVANFLGQSIGWYRQDEPAGFIASVLGAMVLLFIVQAFTGNRANKRVL